MGTSQSLYRSAIVTVMLHNIEPQNSWLKTIIYSVWGWTGGQLADLGCWQGLGLLHIPLILLGLEGYLEPVLMARGHERANPTTPRILNLCVHHRVYCSAGQSCHLNDQQGVGKYFLLLSWEGLQIHMAKDMDTRKQYYHLPQLLNILWKHYF